MPAIEISLPDHIESQIDRLVEQGDFLNRDQAVEELLSLGVSAYDTADTPEPGADENLFTQAVEDQQDPALRDEGDEDYY